MLIEYLFKLFLEWLSWLKRWITSYFVQKFKGLILVSASFFLSVYHLPHTVSYTPLFCLSVLCTGQQTIIQDRTEDKHNRSKNNWSTVFYTSINFITKYSTLSGLYGPLRLMKQKNKLFISITNNRVQNWNCS